MASDFDLNLVRTFVLLYETRSVTAAADLLGVTQPTVSYGLGKLRRRLDDELFVRGPGGLLPTSEAERLYPPLRAALAKVTETLGATAEFDPSRPTRFTLGLSDLGEVTVLPLVLAELAAQAPRAGLRVRAFDLESAADQLARGEMDAIVASPVLDSPRLRRTPLFTEGYAGMVAADHPRLHTAAPVQADLEQERHVVVDGGTGHLGPRKALVEHHLESRIAVRVTRFATLPYVVQDSELVAIVPERVARALARTHSVRIFRLPWPIEPVEVAAYTRHAPERGAPQRWFLEVIRTAMGNLPAL
ncbi:LysR family transcriptional regulator [Nocardia jinanensis]|uniref:LysR family transcriptional regulator n=1 Tax=Nocardia jinanensis TaxID=382504 RepID=A0A917VJ86_9NOCA|nr:LysR family transcriptional regulator [Nocardia jinanensis]GGK90347.1 LysR family transcriptional regulator [Nocardia jinanensis]